MIDTLCRLVTIAVVLAAAGCGHLPAWLRTESPEERPSRELMGEARDLYGRDCAPCHGTDGRGHGPEAAALRLPPPDLTGLAAERGGTFPREYVLDVVTGKVDVPAHGPREMPVWRARFESSDVEQTDTGAAAVAGLFAQRRLDLIAAYVESLQRPRPAPRR